MSTTQSQISSPRRSTQRTPGRPRKSPTRTSSTRSPRSPAKSPTREGHINNPTLKRMALAAGIGRVSAESYSILRNMYEKLINNIVPIAVKLTGLSKRQTVMAQDVIVAAKTLGTTLKEDCREQRSTSAGNIGPDSYFASNAAFERLVRKAANTNYRISAKAICLIQKYVEEKMLKALEKANELMSEYKVVTLTPKILDVVRAMEGFNDKDEF